MICKRRPASSAASRSASSLFPSRIYSVKRSLYSIVCSRRKVRVRHGENRGDSHTPRRDEGAGKDQREIDREVSTGLFCDVRWLLKLAYLSPNIPSKGFDLHLIVQGSLHCTAHHASHSQDMITRPPPPLCFSFPSKKFCLFLTRNARKNYTAKATCTLMQNHIHPHHLKGIVPTPFPIHLALISDVLDCPRHRRTLQALPPTPTH